MPQLPLERPRPTPALLIILTTSTGATARPRIKPMAGDPSPALKGKVKTAKVPAKTAKTKSAGRKGTAFKPSGTFSFQDLPGEIRNQIYRYALVARGPILINRHVDHAAMEKRPAVHIRTSGRSTRNLRLMHKLSAKVKTGDHMHARKLNFRDIHSLSLLLSSKTIRNEARPLLYARNTFRFECAQAFHDFYDLAYNAICFLEDLEFVDLPMAGKPKASLASCVKLTRVAITIKSNMINTDPSAPNHISIIFRALHNLILQCWCDNCKPSKAKPLASHHGDKCIARTLDDQKCRLEMVSLKLRTCSFQVKLVEAHQATHVNANDSGSRKTANQLNAGISARAKQSITRSVSIAELKRKK